MKNSMLMAEAKESAQNNNVLEERAGLENRPCKTMLKTPSPTPAASVMFASAREANKDDPAAAVPLPLRRGVGGGVDIEYPLGFEIDLASTFGRSLKAGNGIGKTRAERASAR